MNFMSTHDTVRAITAIAGESCEGRDRYWQSARRLTPEQYENGRRLMTLAYAMIFTLPGIPSIYYGDEIGMQGYKDPFNRAFFDWESREMRIRPVLQNLAALRKSCPAFADGTLAVTQAQGGVLCYERRAEAAVAAVCINRTEQQVRTVLLGRTVEVQPCSFAVVTDPGKSFLQYIRPHNMQNRVRENLTRFLPILPCSVHPQPGVPRVKDCSARSVPEPSYQRAVSALPCLVQHKHDVGAVVLHPALYASVHHRAQRIIGSVKKSFIQQNGPACAIYPRAAHLPRQRRLFRSVFTVQLQQQRTALLVPEGITAIRCRVLAVQIRIKIHDPRVCVRHCKHAHQHRITHDP